MQAGKIKPTVQKKCPNCGKMYVLDPNVALKDQDVCLQCR